MYTGTASGEEPVLGLRSVPARGGHGSRRALAPARGSHRRKKLMVRKDGHTYSFLYASEHERAALTAFAACPGVDPAEIIAVVCYLGHDPRALGLDIGAVPGKPE